MQIMKSSNQQKELLWKGDKAESPNQVAQTEKCINPTIILDNTFQPYLK